MKYPTKVIEAARVVISFLKAPPGAAGQMPPDLVAAVLALEAKGAPTPEDLMNLWNKLRDPRLKPCRTMSAARRRHCVARLREFPEQKDWEAFIDDINNNDWALGVAPSAKYPNWKAHFDWFIRPDRIVKAIEGGFKQQCDAPKNAREEYGDLLDSRNEMRQSFDSSGEGKN